MTSEPPFSSSALDASIDHTLALEYWSAIPSDLNGMLGGYPQTSRVDLQGSANFLTKLLRRGASTRSTTTSSKQTPLPPLNRVADCGAGIGRITKGLLLGVARTVDVVEPVKKFTDELVSGLGSGHGQVSAVINLGLQDWTPEPYSYNLIWNQWCLGHLTDAQLVAYLRRSPTPNVPPPPPSYIIVKENLSTDPHQHNIYDAEDSSVTRSDAKFRALFAEARLRLVATEVQRGMPRELYPVRMYALRPE
ncbi:alpha-N-methyltransferase NTM1 [Massariosphaeria phaeospora]|uniref:Alpha N-terminal protein methyltransferase 1 n=1 Tax=Massariosphaeria phaeospora TaxID=100035 RepID=A0A7C8ME61_9PLEO|nr:alpha-N-methyltransferase NTM1 [Massariosphaeria phaeospora]